MNYIKLSLLGLLIGSFSSHASQEKFGIVSLQNDVLCTSFGEKPPSIGSSITVVETQSPQYFFQGKLSEGNEICKALEKADVVGPYFTVTTVRKISGPFIGVAVSGTNFLSVINNDVVLALAASRGLVYFRSCTSNEGMYFSLWLGQPLKGQKLWLSYYYLGYDLDPSCEENDFKK